MQFDEQFLQEMGLSAMSEAKKPQFLAYAKTTLETRIGERISEGLEREKLREFDSLTDPDMVLSWLEKNRPDYRAIVQNTISEMKAEIAASRAQLLG